MKEVKEGNEERKSGVGGEFCGDNSFSQDEVSV